MWTPRRILLLLLGVAGFTSAFVIYSQLLGGVDGLPELPAAYTEVDPGGDVVLPEQPVSPTHLRLQEAFGPASPEVLDTVAYKTRLEMRDKGLVFACGPMEFAPEPSRFVTVTPFSVAFFGKEKRPHEMQPGETREISTFHADKAVLEFDREVAGPQDLQGKRPARLVGMELVSVPDMPSHDPRRGQIEVVNNQKSRDPGQFLVFRTPGPLYYRAPEQTAQSPDAPQVWTTAAVEVVDRRNLPRPLRSLNTTTARTRGEELRRREAVADILLGVTLPPPTMTAEGMKIYLEPQDEKTDPAKRNSTGYSGVRQIELNEKVQINLWSDGGSGFPGAAPQETAAKPVEVDPPAALAAVGGAAVDGAAVARKFADKTLMVIETLGPFRYDFRASRARFEAAAIPNPVSNHVTVARYSAAGTQDNLFCKVLVIDFFGADEPDPKAPPKQPDRPRKAGQKQQAARPSEGMKIKSLTATGPHVFISVEAEKLLAQGTELHYTTDPKARRSDTLLRGTPVVAERERNRMLAGSATAPADVLLATTEPPPGSKDHKRTAVTVVGPGRMELFDQASGDTTLHASWGKSLNHEKEKVGDVEQDLLKFEGGGSFEDTKGEMALSADRLWLWLAPAGDKKEKAAKSVPDADPSKSLPQRLLAVNHVQGHSGELVIENTDQFTAWFRDVPPPQEPPPPAVAQAPQQPAQPGAAPPPAGQPPVAAKTEPAKEEEPKKKDPPVRLSARVVESWVVRYPRATPPAKPGPAAGPAVAKADPAKPAGKQGEPALQYELERARCEDRVVVDQDPTDPLKNPRGLHIVGAKLNLDHSQAGSVMTVTGAPDAQAEVHFESMDLYGPAVVIDQPNNAVAVDGVGRLLMPSQSDLGGGETSRPTEMEIKWVTSMRFRGTTGTGARAVFVGQVHAEQHPSAEQARKPEAAPPPRVRLSAYRPAADPAVATRPAPPPDDGSWGVAVVLCHQLDATFDRPVYFNNYRRSQPKPAKPGEPVAANDDPKLKTAVCTPMPDDEATQLPPRNAAIAKRVYYLDQSFTKDGKLTKAQRVDSLDLVLKNDEKERVQQVFATGPGEVRILQYGAKDDTGQPQQQPATRPAPPGQQPQPAGEQELKLTLVKFNSRMAGRDMRKVAFQEVTFDDGADV